MFYLKGRVIDRVYEKRATTRHYRNNLDPLEVTPLIQH